MGPESRIPYERYFDVATVPEAGMVLHSYDYLRQLTDNEFDTYPVWDAHAHIGKDVDGHVLTADDLLAELHRYHVHGAVIFPFDDPDQGDTFEVPNDRVWKAHEQAPDRLVPFMRLNPNGPWEAEYERCLVRGFRGIKLHPRAQRFDLASPKVRPLFARAANDGLPVLVHTGYGMTKAVTDDIAALAVGFENLKLVLGHSSFIDIRDALRMLSPYPNVIFETSVVKVYDLLTLFSRVDPSRVVYGSDLPYGSPYSALQTVVKVARFAGIAPEHRRGLLGGNLLRLLGDEGEKT